MLIAAKWVHLDEIVGQLKEEKEEEPEGKVLGDSDTGSLFYSSLLPINLLIQFILVFVYIAFSFFSFPFRWFRRRGGKRKAPHSRRRRHRCHKELGRGWGPPGSSRRGSKRIVGRGMSLSLFFFILPSSFHLSLTCLLPISLTIFDASDCYLLFSSFFTGCETTPMCQLK